MKSLEQQISEAKNSYPTLKTRSQNSYSIIFPDSPKNLFEIFIKPEFPNEAPLVHMNGEKIQISITTFWYPNFAFIQLLQHLHLYSIASNNGNFAFSPATKNLPSPSIYENKHKPSNSSMKYYGRLISFPKENNGEVIIEEEEEEPEDINFDEETYQRQLNALNQKLKKRQIHIPEYISEHQSLKKKL
ncbi:hypothetical protein M9Y10_008476 [Tritrichomonas musculus]|uniref:UBC core domain-containing protein n=1 Tax=Tritrichomonas musculus TaxID=1915356 RepID=A0ABR2IYA2_9EUKA